MLKKHHDVKRGEKEEKDEKKKKRINDNQISLIPVKGTPSRLV